MAELFLFAFFIMYIIQNGYIFRNATVERQHSMCVRRHSLHVHLLYNLDLLNSQRTKIHQICHQSDSCIMTSWRYSFHYNINKTSRGERHIKQGMPCPTLHVCVVVCENINNVDNSYYDIHIHTASV